jgi:hypothetical protein
VPARLLRSPVGDARAVRRWVAAYAVNGDSHTVKLRPRFVCSKHSAGPQLLIRKVRNVGLAVPGIYEDPVLVDHVESLPSRGRAQGRARAGARAQRAACGGALAVIERGGRQATARNMVRLGRLRLAPSPCDRATLRAHRPRFLGGNVHFNCATASIRERNAHLCAIVVADLGPRRLRRRRVEDFTRRGWAFGPRRQPQEYRFRYPP